MSIAINFIDRNSENRKILWAVVASVFIHFVAAFFLAAFGGKLSALPQVDETPPELTIVNVVPAPVPMASADRRFIETDEAKKSTESPKEKTFESNANSVAASQLLATGESDLPTMEGKDRPFTGLEKQEASIAFEGAQPTPAPTPAPQASQPPPSTPTPAPATTPAPEQFAMLTSTPSPAVRTPEVEARATPQAEAPTSAPSETTPAPTSAYRAYKEPTHVSGRITNRGSSSVNAVGTPLGRYEKIIYDAIGSRWLYYTRKQGDLVNIGTVRVSFAIDREGHVENLKMTGNTSNEAFANVCLQSVQEAKPPPIPDEVADILPPEGLIFEIGFTIFPNQ